MAPGQHHIALGIIIAVVLVGFLAIMYQVGKGVSTTASAENMVASVGNRASDGQIAWNSTPTRGMFSSTEAPNAPSRPPQYDRSKPLAGMGVDEDTSGLGMGGEVPVARCEMPTGFLLAMANAWQEGKRQGIVSQNGIPFLDMGTDGAFYDTTGLGCCDTYCRKVSKGGYWSCIDPQTVGTQYRASNPRGTKCPGGYGQRLPLPSES